MKTRDQIYGKEASELLRNITAYHHIRQDQLLRMYPGKESKIENLLRHLVSQGRILYSAENRIYHDSSEVTPNYGTLASLWVLIDFYDRVEYHSPVDFPASLVFLLEGEIYEVLYIPSGNENLTEYALSSQGSDAGKRIVVVEDADQIPRLSIPQATAFCTVEMDTGLVQYFKQEVSDG